MRAGEMPSTWHKSSFSQGGDCVEWARTKELIHVRNSNDPSGRTLDFTHSEWQAFINGVKAGEADLDSEDL
jgi:hypothetical protein